MLQDAILKQIQKPKHPAILSFVWSLLITLPALLLGKLVIEDPIPVQYSYFVSCTIVLLAVFDFTTVVFIEQYRRKLSKLTIPALLATILVIFMFLTLASLSRFFKHMDYGYLDFFVYTSGLLTYAAIFRDKNIVMKVYLSMNACALAILWAMGASDKIVMPF